MKRPLLCEAWGGGKAPEEVMPSEAEIRRVTSALGRIGGKIGGAMRGKSLSAERRTEIARKAAQARWKKDA